MSSQHHHQGRKLIEQRILRTVQNTIAAHSMIEDGDSVLVAVSGGPDSVALVHILTKLAAIYSLRLGIAHVNHCLRREDSDRDAVFVVRLAQKLNLAVYTEKRPARRFQRRHNLSLEEAARRIRYEFLHQAADTNGFAKIAVGHHYDDNAELVLLFLLRGSGLLGLSGIPPVRDGRIIRPLLAVKRADIMAYLAENELEYVIDTSNADLRHMRNKLRHDLIPKIMSSYNPKIYETLNRIAAISRSENAWLNALINSVFDSICCGRDERKICLSSERFGQLPLAAKRRVIRKAIAMVKGNLRRISFTHTDAAVSLAAGTQTAGFLNLPGGIRIQRNRENLMISQEKKDASEKGRARSVALVSPYEYTITPPGSVHIKETGAELTFAVIDNAEIDREGHAGQQIVFFDIHKLRFPLVVRNFRPGDRFSPLGMSGTQKVKKFFSNNKIPREQRARCPLLVSDRKIIWVAGYRIDNAVQVNSNTRTVLKAELLLA